MRSFVVVALACAACVPARHHCHHPGAEAVAGAAYVTALFVQAAVSSNRRAPRERSDDYVCKHNPECKPPDDPYCADAPDGCCPCD